MTDDLIKVCLDCLAIFKRNATSVSLAMHVLMKPLSKNEPVPRKETLLLIKLLLEGTSSELMIVLGWLIDTQYTATASTATTGQIRTMTEGAKRSNRESNNIKSSLRVPDWEASTCRLHHSLVPSLPVSILGSSALFKEKNSKHPLQLFNKEIENMILYDILLEQAHTGISMNGLVLRNPTCMGSLIHAS